MIFNVRHYERLGSTNDEARGLAAEGAEHGTVVHADEQTAGRGRLARTWFSPAGNLYLSLVLRLETPSSRLQELSFLASLAVADTVDAMLPKHVRAMLKWPNDVLIAGAKIAGILIEQADDATIVGIGLNILHTPSSAGYKTTSIVASGGLASVDGARDILLDRFGKRLAVWQADGFGPVRDAWMERAHPIGASLRVMVSGETVEGAFGGLDVDGALLLDVPGGRQRVVAGDVGVV
jgi:BirA family transcriptional regulator, biotin operon repressor / biotin---[acetyl-CoA-carboxylase] ligase